MQQDSFRKATTALIPLFLEQAMSVAMIQYSMNVIKQATEYLNLGQVPIIALDQPLCALAKQIQWDNSTVYGEDHFVIMFGGLHIEMEAFKAAGTWLEDSGWTNILVQANVASVENENVKMHTKNRIVNLFSTHL